MNADHHADTRDRQRFKRRYGQTTTNPGMRIVMRELAHKDRDTEHAPQVTPSSSPGKRRVRLKRRRKR